MKKSNYIIILATALLTISTSAYSENGPTNEQLQTLLTNFFKKHTPIEWVHYAAVGKIKKIEFLEINRDKSLKEYNRGQLPQTYSANNSDCWPVKTHVKGVALSMLGSEYPFEDKPRFIICQGYGNQASWRFYPEKLTLAVNNTR
ncbi:MAG: hypothetical protein ACD_7C00279G0007 [uncultured bacterium]|nr:MAG: hypothetical protein ACD_7C00279G0007 [uncultured bacterium]HBR79745.1 hypothetical protein [Candidatus Moranbacteria bacterium]